MKKLIITVFLIVFSGLATYGGYQSGSFRFNYPKMSKKQIKGIDVSHHQGEIDWSKIKNQEIDFVFIKSTEGGDFKDKKFNDNMEAATKVGLLTGAYHFFTLCRPGADQARNFIESVNKDKVSLPPVVDVEFVGNCNKRPKVAEFESELDDYLQVIENHYGRVPIIYTTHEFIAKYLQSKKYNRFPLWIRDIFKKPSTVNGREWIIWQFADNARLEGIKGPVDLNLFRGDKTALKNL